MEGTPIHKLYVDVPFRVWFFDLLIINRVSIEDFSKVCHKQALKIMQFCTNMSET